MMGVTADTFYKVPYNSNKENIATGTTTPACGATEIALHVGSSVDISGNMGFSLAVEALRRYLKNNFASITAGAVGLTTLSCPPGGGTVTTSLAAGNITLYIGLTALPNSGQVSSAIDDLVAAFLEDSRVD